MPRVSGIEILHKREQPVLYVRPKTPVEGLPALIGASFGKMAAYLAERGEHLADMPYVAYHNKDMRALDVEIGFPVAIPLPAKDGIEAGTLPEGRVAFCIYQGPYSNMIETYGELHAWIDDHGYVTPGPAYECYYNGPEVAESDLLTMIVMPVIKA